MCCDQIDWTFATHQNFGTISYCYLVLARSIISTNYGGTIFADFDDKSHHTHNALEFVGWSDVKSI